MGDIIRVGWMGGIDGMRDKERERKGGPKAPSGQKCTR